MRNSARCSRIEGLTWLLVGLVGCKGSSIVEPSLDILVTRDGTTYDFSFKGCSRWFRNERIEVSRIVVRKGVGQPDSLPVQCELSKSSPSVRNIAGHWQYGAAPPPGYEMTPCDPLQPGQTYQVHAGGLPNGRRVFTVKENGDVALGEGSCD